MDVIHVKSVTDAIAALERQRQSSMSMGAIPNGLMVLLDEFPIRHTIFAFATCRSDKGVIHKFKDIHCPGVPDNDLVLEISMALWPFENTEIGRGYIRANDWYISRDPSVVAMLGSS